MNDGVHVGEPPRPLARGSSTWIEAGLRTQAERHLLWLGAPEDWVLDPVLAQRFGSVESGNRGGIVCKGDWNRLKRWLEAILIRHHEVN